MPLVLATMAPHGFFLIPDMHPDAEGGMQTRAALEEMSRRIAAVQPDIVVVATPHGFRVDGHVMVSNAARGAGAIRWAGKTVEQNVPFDQTFARALGETARAAGVPVAMGSYAGGGDSGVLPLDWGTITPLWFAGYPQNMTGAGDVLAEPPTHQTGPTIVAVCPARDLAAADLIAFGRALVDTAAADGRRVVYIASCDWSHRHRADGPYGYSDVAAPADARIVSAIQRNDLASLATVTQEEVQAAAMDGLAQTLILAGVIERTAFTADLLSYEVPTYYGMIVATWS